MSTERQPLPDDEAQSRRRIVAHRWLMAWLSAMMAVAIGMVVDFLRDGEIHLIWSLLAVLLVLPYFWRRLQQGLTQTAAKTGQRTKSRPRSGRGQKPMIWLVGAMFAAFAIANEVQSTGDRGPLWRVLVAILAFLYLWWLSSLLFDLAFVWHRYIQGDAAHRFLRERVQRKDFNPKNDSPEEPPPSMPSELPPPGPSGGSSTPARSPSTHL